MVESGRLSGVIRNGTLLFKGIAFAAPPVSSLSMRPPAPAQAWRRPQLAAEYGHECTRAAISGNAAPLRAEQCEAFWRRTSGGGGTTGDDAGLDRIAQPEPDSGANSTFCTATGYGPATPHPRLPIARERVPPVDRQLTAAKESLLRSNCEAPSYGKPCISSQISQKIYIDNATGKECNDTLCD